MVTDVTTTNCPGEQSGVIAAMCKPSAFVDPAARIGKRGGVIKRADLVCMSACVVGCE